MARLSRCKRLLICLLVAPYVLLGGTAAGTAAAADGPGGASGPGGPGDPGGPPDLGALPETEPTRAPARTFLLTLEAGAFAPSPEHPSALVYLPSGFDPTPPVSVVVYLHGLNNCVENIVRKAGEEKACTPGGAVRNAYDVIGQMESAGKNAILLVPEVAFDQVSADPGKLGTANGFRALLAEALRKLSGPLADLDLSGIGEVVLASHSGAYAAAAAIALRGGVPLSELYLLDSIYGNVADFEAFIQKDLSGFFGPLPQRRFAAIYTDTGGTVSNTLTLLGAVAAAVPERSLLVDDRTTATLQPASLHHPLLFKRSGLSHDNVARHYFQLLLASSNLPPIL